MMICKIDNTKPFVKADFVQLKDILKDTEFRAKRNGKYQFQIFCTRPVILSAEGMFEYVMELVSSQFKPQNNE